MEEQPKPFRFSLKTMLGLMLVFGVGIGMLGHAFNHYPEVFRVVVIALSSFIPFILATLTVIALGNRLKDRRVVLWGVILTLMPFFGMGVLGISQPFLATSGPSGLKALSTSSILKDRLPKDIDSPWVWRELASRVGTGDITSQQADAAIGQLIGFINTNYPSGCNSTMSWQKNFLLPAYQAQLISQPKSIELCDAYFGNAFQLGFSSKYRSTSKIIRCKIRGHEIHWADGAGIPYLPVWSIESLSIDNEQIAFNLDDRYSRHGRHLSHQSYQSNNTLEPGDYKLSAKIQVAYVDPSLLVGLNSGFLDKSSWPKPVHEQVIEVQQKLHVYAEDESLVKLTTDPTYHPLKKGYIKVNRLLLQPAGENKSRLIIKSRESAGDEVGYAFTVYAVIDGKRHKLQKYLKTVDQSTSYGIDAPIIKRPKADLRTVDLLFEPAIEAFEASDKVETLWNEPVWIRNFRLERFDVDSE